MSAPQQLLELVERFGLHLDSYKSGTYNEAQLRREFLDPFFKLLGWDIDNQAGYAEAYKDVIHEDALKSAAAQRLGTPDYCFRIGGTRKFFLEAKKPAIFIKEEITAAFQLRSYAWSAKLPLSILSDFEEFAIYDCRIKPFRNDSASRARIFYCTFAEYAEKWDYIASIFSRNAVLKGSFDKFAETSRGRRGTTEVDTAFLLEIENWRKELAENLALRNQKLTERELNFAVQRIIDRIVFLRICEDRGTETYGRLQALVSGQRIYPRLCQLFQQADDRYNSGLFHFKAEPGRHERPDELTLELAIDDELLRRIIKHLYYPESPYVFSFIPADILGQVYEQFLGKVITLTAGHRARIEEKPEVRKAGGVYYTPTYIVDYIVRHTVGKLLDECAGTATETKPSGSATVPVAASGVSPEASSQVTRAMAPEDARPPISSVPLHGPIPPTVRSPQSVLNKVAKLKILDPACGSGSFLIGAYQYLLDWHLRFYLANNPEKFAKGKRPALVQTARGEWKLSIEERKRVLVNNIFGVDIDSQAVEVTKLSLLLKVLEGETEQSLQPLFSIFHERALPDLGDNIKCGNSLIGPDFYRQPDLPLLTDEQKYRINVFDWRSEFSGIFEAGGFDAVIGNPPYVRQELLAQFKSYFEQRYDAFDGVADLYAYFMEKGVHVLRDSGRFSIIVSSSFLRASYAKNLRRTLKQHAAVESIVDFGGLPIFTNAKDTYVCIPLLIKGAQQARVRVAKIASVANIKHVEASPQTNFTVPHERLSPEAWSLKSDSEAAVFAKITKAGRTLGEYVDRKFFRGILTGLNEAFEISANQRRDLVQASAANGPLIKPFLGGQDIRRYHIEKTDRFLIVIPYGWTQAQMIKAARSSTDVSERAAWVWFGKHFSALAEHLAAFSDALRKRQDQGDYWWELRPCDYYAYLDAPKIIFPDICKGPRFYLDRSGTYLANTAYCLGTDDLYLLGILNSRLFWFAISNLSIPFGIRAGEYRYRLIYQYMEKVPIRVISPNNQYDVRVADSIMKLSGEMLALNKQLPATRTPHEKTALERQIEATDRQIDALVYELYGLTPEEIAIVEGKTPVAESDAWAASVDDIQTDTTTESAKPEPAAPVPNPDKAWADSAHFYSAKEEPTPYRTDENEETTK